MSVCEQMGGNMKYCFRETHGLRRFCIPLLILAVLVIIQGILPLGQDAYGEVAVSEDSRLQDSEASDVLIKGDGAASTRKEEEEFTGAVAANASEGKLSVSASFSKAPANVAFAITDASGAVAWFQAYREDADGLQWAASISLAKDLAGWGSYRIESYATIDSSTHKVAETSYTYAKPAASVAVKAEGSNLLFTAGSWSETPSNVAFEVVSPAGRVRWLQGIQQPDGSWEASASATDDFGALGIYRATVFATIDGATAQFGSATGEVSIGNLAIEAMQAGSNLSISISDWALDVSNVAFEVVKPSGRIDWVQAVKGSGGTWGAAPSIINELREWGTYRIRVWATTGKLTSRVSEARAAASAGSPSVSATPAGSSFALRATGWFLSPDNVAFCVTSPMGGVTWLQGKRQQDGSWTASASTMANGIISSGSYRVIGWASHGKITASFGSTVFRAAESGISVSATAQDDTLSFLASGFSGAPSNVAFEVKLPSGKTVWKQAQRSMNGTWSYRGSAVRDFGEFGSYTAVAWATFGAGTFPYASSSCYVSSGSVGVAVRANGAGKTVSASGWAVAPSNVAFQVISSGKQPVWLQGKKSTDGSWSANLGAGLSQARGRVVVWATMGRVTASFGETSFGDAVAGVVASAAVDGTRLSFRAAGWSAAPDNVAFEVKTPRGRLIWLQGIQQHDGSWTAEASATDDFGEWGLYDMTVWVTVDGKTQQYGGALCRVDLGALAITAITQGTSVTLSASGWDIAPKNVAFQIIKPSGASSWIQATLQGDGSWTAKASVLNDLREWGSFKVIAHATVGKLTTSCGTTSFTISAGNVGVYSSVSGNRFSLSAKGWMRAPSNVAFRVLTPSGERWIQGVRQSDGSWTAGAGLSDGFQSGGVYMATAYATIDGLTTSFGSSTFVFQPYQNEMHRKAQWYRSATSWLILVDTVTNHVGVFSGRVGAWNLANYWQCSTGKPSSPTVKGEFTVQSRGYVFGHGYSCYYYTQFYGDYLFHSVLYQPGTRDLLDGRLGMNISAGCVRLDINNAKWIHDNIPSGTKVVVY